MSISNLHKAAVFLSSLPKERAAKLLEQLDPGQRAAVAAEMGVTGEIDRNEQEAIFRDFAAAYPADDVGRPPPEDPPFQFLQKVPGEEISQAIAGEHPQTAALILSRLPPRLAGDVLSGLESEARLSVVRRMAAMRQPNLEIVREVAMVMRHRLDTAHAGPPGRREDRREKRRGVSAVVRMFNAMKPTAERALLGELAEADPMLLREIRRAMFGADVAECVEQGIG